MNITLSQAIKFPNFYREIQDLKLPIKTVHKLSRISKELAFHIDFYWENLQKITLEYAQFNDDGTPRLTEDGEGILLIPGRIQECSKKIDELGALTIELADALKINISDLEDMELTLQSFEAIEPFIEN